MDGAKTWLDGPRTPKTVRKSAEQGMSVEWSVSTRWGQGEKGPSCSVDAATVWPLGDVALELVLT